MPKLSKRGKRKSLVLIDNIIKAWEHLPEGEYSVSEINHWLLYKMQPAVNKCRKYIQEIPITERKK
jgi:hypothetical protein